MAVKSLPIENSKEVAASIVHETFHLVNKHLLESKSNFKIDMYTNSFKLFDEGYAQLIQAKFMNNQLDIRKSTDAYTKNIALTNSFNFYDLKTKWTELFSNKDVYIYKLAFSFSCFLEDKFGINRVKNLFLPTEIIIDNSWQEYVINYFNTSIDNLINDWLEDITH